MSLVLRKPVFGVSDTNRAAQSLNMARDLKFQFKVEEVFYFPGSENKGTDQLQVTAKLICVFVFVYAKKRFSHGEDQMLVEQCWSRVVRKPALCTCLNEGADQLHGNPSTFEIRNFKLLLYSLVCVGPG